MEYGPSGRAFRTALFALAALLLLAFPALAASDGVTNYRALLIGNSQYQSVDDLGSCAYDLGAMRSALTSGTVTYKKISSYSSLTRSGIQSAVNGVLTWGADDDDVTVFYYTGHGASSGLAGVDHSSSKDGVYPFSLLQSTLSGVPGKVIVLLDSCKSGGLINKSAESAGSFTDNAIAAFSGASGGLSSKAITSGEKFHVIASSSQSQYSYAKTNLYGLSTWALCEAMGWSHNGPSAGNRLESLEGDANGDLTVTVGEAYAFAAQAVGEELAKYNYTQDMKAYPEDGGLTLVSRAAAAPAAVETPKAVYRPGVLNLSKACIAPDKTLQLTLNVEGATQVHWSTSKSSVATVDKDTGLVTGHNYSYSVIPRISVTYFVSSNSFYAYCDVRVLPLRYVVQTVQLKYATKTLEKGASYTIPVKKIYPSSARYKSLRWSSSDETVAEVGLTNGKIKAVADTGTAVITATATSGVTASVTVNAIPARARSVSLNYKTRTLIPGQLLTLNATVLPASTKDKSVKWESSREDIAEVDDTGLVTANKDGVYGKTVISATTTETGKVAYCTVTVVRNQSIPRTKPKSASGKLIPSARRIYYNATGSLVIDMWFYNRTGYPQKVPTPNPGLVVLKLKNVKEPLTALKTFTSTVTVPSGGYRLYTIRLNLEDYPNFSGLDLRGSDATYEAQN